MEALEAILGRRTVPQLKMTGPGPDKAELRAILEAGAAAPDHGKLRPWRFLLVEGEARARLGALFVRALLAASPDASAAEIEKQRTAPLRAPLLIVVVARIDRRQDKIPEVEQIASTAAAAQNILLATHALGFAGKWSTGRIAYDPVVKAGLGLGPDEHVLGFVYIGAYARPQEPSPRPDLADLVTTWTGPGVASP
jgi:nitroreductase